MIKKVSGSVLEVFNADSNAKPFKSDFREISKPEVNEAQIKADLARTHLVDFSGKKFSDFEQECDTEDNYSQQFKQDNLEGAGVVDLYQRFINNRRNALKRADDRDEFSINWVQGNKKLRFAYRDEQSDLCGFGLVFNEKHPESWALQITKKTTAPLEKRTATLFTSGALSKSITSTDKMTNLSDEIKLALGSAKVAQLITGLIDNNGRISSDKFEKLHTRINPFKTIDDRDTKIQALQEIADGSKVDPASKQLDPATKQLITQSIELSKSNINYFKDITLEEIQTLAVNPGARPLINKLNNLNQETINYKREIDAEKARFDSKINSIRQSEPTLDKKSKQSFFQRNRGKLALLGLGLLAMVSAALVLTGVLAPLGLALAAGLATNLAIGAAAAAGGVAASSGIMIARQERELGTYRQTLTEAKQEHNQHVIAINATYADAVAPTPETMLAEEIAAPELTPTDDSVDSALGSSHGESPAGSPVPSQDASPASSTNSILSALGGSRSPSPAAEATSTEDDVDPEQDSSEFHTPTSSSDNSRPSSPEPASRQEEEEAEEEVQTTKLSR